MLASETDSAIDVSAEFFNREGHFAETCTRIVFVLRNTFLVGHAVIGRFNEKLRGAFDTNDGKDAYGYSQDARYIARDQRTVEFVENSFGNVETSVATTVVADTVFFAAIQATSAFCFDAEDDWRHRFDNGDGETCGLNSNGAVTESGVGIAAERGDLSLSAVENDAFFKNDKSVEFLGSAARTDFERQNDVGFYGNAEEAAIQHHGFNTDAGPEDVRAFCAYGAATAYKVLTVGG